MTVRCASPLAGAIALVVAGCITGQDVLVERSWRLASVGGRPPAAEAGASFGTDGRFTIQTGCNSGGGTYHLDGNRILLDSETLTEMACDEPRAAQEAAILGVIEGMPTYAIDTGTGRLRLTGPGGVVLVFEASRPAGKVRRDDAAGCARQIA